MTEQQPWMVAELCYSKVEFRQDTAAMVCAEGVTDVAALKVTPGGSGLNVSVAAGQGFIFGDDLPPDQGVYRVRNDGPVTLTAGTADGTNPRIDTVVATVRDSDYGGADNDWILQIVAGTPTVGATLANLSGAAAVPNDSIVLAYLLVPASFAGPFVDATHILDGRQLFTSCGQPQVRSTTYTRSTNQSIANNTATTLQVSTPTGTSEASGFLTSSSGVVTVKRAGVYHLEGSVVWAGNTDSNRRAIQFSVNGSVVSRGSIGPNLNAAGQATVQQAAADIVLAANDTVAVTVTQNSGGALNATGSLVLTRIGTLVS